MRNVALFSIAMFLVWVPVGLVATVANAAVITLSGTVHYQGAYSGDTLYVVVIDTTQAQDVTFLSLKAYAVGSPFLGQAYAIDFDNAAAPPEVIVAALLDVDGGGVQNVSGNDIVGWYAGAAAPTGISSADSQGGLDFDLPRAEIQGTITLAPGQTDAWIDVTQNPQCQHTGFNRPRTEITASGPYAIRGFYAGEWCISAEGNYPPSLFVRVCYGDPACVNPTLVSLTAAQVKTGVDLDLSAPVPAQGTSWGRLKSRY
jgi:hypothetical protein